MLESVIKQIKGGACGGGQHGFNLHNLLFPPAFAADCTFETLSGKQITISAKDDCIDAIIASLQGQVLAVTWNAKEFSVGLKDGAIQHGEAFAELVSDPKAAGKKYGAAIVSDLQEQSGKYIAALAAGNHKEAGELAAGLAIDLTIKIAVPAAGTSIAVLKSSTAIEKLTAKVERRERSGVIASSKMGNVKEARPANRMVSTGAGNVADAARLRMQLSAEQVAGIPMPLEMIGHTKHGINQAISRGGLGVSVEAILNVWKNPSKIEYVPTSKGPPFRLTGHDAVIVVNQQGQVITTWARNSSGVRGK